VALTAVTRKEVERGWSGASRELKKMLRAGVHRYWRERMGLTPEDGMKDLAELKKLFLRTQRKPKKRKTKRKGGHRPT
jgi:hypothetical protein